ncbi:twin-arginine translocase TatA/TatE family subunit [Sphingomonas mesophila]|uniref:twin-arginine translocase TatA/TatE family subunit n=1 Tax=Sphingomonas mesophila TaxID=2303576 RepID=UPI000E567E56|nr:twin-arginine translocase TatA/TatE family subunit [Sphingomonas mesophila]
MGSFSLIHWIILGIVILLLFGGNRFSAMMKDVAHGLKSFKQGLSEEDEKKQAEFRAQQDQRQIPPAAGPMAGQQPIDLEARPSADPAPRDDQQR